MISIKSAKEIEVMSEACKIAAGALQVAKDNIKAGMSTLELDILIDNYYKSMGAKSSSKGYGGFPRSNCISLNDEVIHGIPSKKRIIKDGDIVSIDACVNKNGFHGDNAYTFMVGNVSDDAKKLLEVTEEALYKGIEQAQAGNRVGDISHAIQTYVESHGYSVLRKFIGHGIGKKLHEEPDVPNFGAAGKGPRLSPGMTIAIEPMVNAVGTEVFIANDKWTVKTASGSLSAHFEHTVLISKNGPVILTKSV